MTRNRENTTCSPVPLYAELRHCSNLSRKFGEVGFERLDVAPIAEYLIISKVDELDDDP